MEALQEKLSAPRDIASLAAFRFLFGAILFASTLRFLVNGWVGRFFDTPAYFFPYWGFEWLPVASPSVMVALHVALAVASLFFALGLFYRIAAPALFVLFTYVELVDVTNYLNHYYLVSLLALLFCFMPLGSALSLDVLQKPSMRRTKIPAWMLYLVRLQIGVVYFYAGLAKAEPDWLLHAQPLGIWLAARAELPIVGPLLALPATAFVMSWAGFLNDILAVPLLLHPRSRKFAFAMLVVFHAGTHLLFTIGVFPFLMPVAATIFFAPDWPRTWFARLTATASTTSRVGGAPFSPLSRVGRFSPLSRVGRFSPLSRVGLVALLAYAALQVLVPLRTHLYDGSVLWHEQGMRYSWRVMLREKNGSISYRVRTRAHPRERVVTPARYLTRHQEREMSGQPDMILRLAHHIAEEQRARGERDVEVRVDALVSLNGRPAALMIDPDVNLAAIEDGLSKAEWITAMPDGPPLSALRPTRIAVR
jgi:hypothetical protein